jgi:hypothetical protein
VSRGDAGEPLTASAWDPGLVGLVQFLLALLLTIPAGQLVDHVDRRALAAQLSSYVTHKLHSARVRYGTRPAGNRRRPYPEGRRRGLQSARLFRPPVTGTQFGGYFAVDSLEGADRVIAVMGKA